MKITKSTDLYLPENFRDGRPINQIILVCDVDGVIRDCCNSDADPRIVVAIKELIKEHQIDIAFISGTPATQRSALEIWRRGHTTLDKAIAEPLANELKKEEISIYGALGGQRMRDFNHIEILDEYPIEIVFELSKILLHAFFHEIDCTGTQEQKELTRKLKAEVETLTLKDKNQSPQITPNEFAEIALTIRSKIDPRFRLVSYGALIETLTSNPPWGITNSVKWLEKELSSKELLISKLPKEQRQIAMGLGSCDGFGFNFLMVSKVNKSLTIKKHIEERCHLYPDALIITIGDTQVDFPMHQHAHLAYHVGKEHVWSSQALPQCMLVQDHLGFDSQHVKGTLHVLKLIKEGVGKPISEWNI